MEFICTSYITLSAFQTPPTPKVTSGASTCCNYMLYEILPTGPARRLATQQVGYDQKGNSAVHRRRLQQRRLQQHSQYHFLDGAKMSLTSYWGQQRMSLTSYPVVQQITHVTIPWINLSLKIVFGVWHVWLCPASEPASPARGSRLRRLRLHAGFAGHAYKRASPSVWLKFIYIINSGYHTVNFYHSYSCTVNSGESWEIYLLSLKIGYGTTENSPITFQTLPDDPLVKRTSTVGRVHPHCEVRFLSSLSPLLYILSFTNLTWRTHSRNFIIGFSQCSSLGLIINFWISEQAKIVDEEGDIVPIGVSGELLTRGYCVMRGYWEDPIHTAKAISDDRWYHTGWAMFKVMGLQTPNRHIISAQYNKWYHTGWAMFEVM